MDKQLHTLKKIDGIFDIQPPAIPDMSTFDIILVLTIFMFITGLIIYVSHTLFFSRKGKARRNIKNLRTSYTNNQNNQHDAIYHLCFYLQQGLNIRYIGADTILPEKLSAHKKEWVKFIQTLSVLRYKKNSSQQIDINHLFTLSLYWLRLWP